MKNILESNWPNLPFLFHTSDLFPQCVKSASFHADTGPVNDLSADPDPARQCGDEFRLLQNKIKTEGPLIMNNIRQFLLHEYGVR
jgi:hypothetical protein